jgi:hypothetical protein
MFPSIQETCEQSLSGRGVYLYCFTPPGVPAEPPDGESSGRGRLIAGEVAAVFSTVPLADWQGPAAEAHLQDSQWVIPRALAHEQVIEKHLARGPVLPVRFGAIFSSEAALLEFMRPRLGEISQFLDRMRELEEWSLKGYLHSEAAEQWVALSDPALAERRQRLPAAPGARYFQEKRLQAEIQERARQLGRTLAESLAADLTAPAVEVRPLGSRPPDDSGREMILHAALLLPRVSVGAFRDYAERVQAAHRDRGLTLEITGPWPPFNFCPRWGDESP